MTEGTHVSVLIPVLNEKQNIARLITLFDELFGSAVHSSSQKKETLHPRDNINLSLIFVDDGSEDGTCEIIAEMANWMNLDIHLLSRGKQGGGMLGDQLFLKG